MVGSMSHAAGHHPCPRSPHVEESRFVFPPHLILVTQFGQALSAIAGVSPDEFQPGLICRQRRRLNINVEHCSKPEVFANTLMHHVLLDTAPTHVAWVRPEREVLVIEHGPGADHLDALGFVRFDQKVVSHQISLNVSLSKSRPVSVVLYQSDWTAPSATEL